MNPLAPADEWSADRGCGVQYLSQQAVNRLLGPAGIQVPQGMNVPERLEQVQDLMRLGDPRAEKIYQTIGVYFGYALAHYANYYDIGTVLVMGRVTTGPGGDIILRSLGTSWRASSRTCPSTSGFPMKPAGVWARRPPPRLSRKWNRPPRNQSEQPEHAGQRV